MHSEYFKKKSPGSFQQGYTATPPMKDPIFGRILYVLVAAYCTAWNLQGNSDAKDLLSAIVTKPCLFPFVFLCLFLLLFRTIQVRPSLILVAKFSFPLLPHSPFPSLTGCLVQAPCQGAGALSAGEGNDSQGLAVGDGVLHGHRGL